MKTRSAFILLLFVALLVLPSTSFAEGIIGVDRFFSLQPVSFLLAKTVGEEPYVAAFNYFFTIEIFVGLVALWLRWLMRVLRM